MDTQNERQRRIASDKAQDRCSAAQSQQQSLHMPVFAFVSAGSSSKSADYLNSCGANSIRFARHTIQVCIPGVSLSVKFTFFVFNHALNLRFSSIR